MGTDHFCKKNGVTNLVMVMSEFLAYTYVLEHFWKFILRGFLRIKKYPHDTFETIDLKGSVTPVHKISKVISIESPWFSPTAPGTEKFFLKIF